MTDETPLDRVVDKARLSDLAWQREHGWPNYHPEKFCQVCGGHNVRSWSVDSDRFNAAMAALGLDRGAIVCPACFVAGHEKATGLACSWTLRPATPFRPTDA